LLRNFTHTGIASWRRPGSVAAIKGLIPGLIADGVAAVDAWNKWHRARTPAA